MSITPIQSITTRMGLPTVPCRTAFLFSIKLTLENVSHWPVDLSMKIVGVVKPIGTNLFVVEMKYMGKAFTPVEWSFLGSIQSMMLLHFNSVSTIITKTRSMEQPILKQIKLLVLGNSFGIKRSPNTTFFSELPFAIAITMTTLQQPLMIYLE